MKIYGVALLAFCYLLGKYLGQLLGQLIGVNADVGGVGFAMFFLILSISWLKKKGFLEVETTSGMKFWSSMYIPVVIAMASVLNVKGALSGGWAAVIIGAVVTLSCLALVPLISKIGQNK
ncbi:malonate transporter subunit MadL [Jiulongibacter sp. NS-SX5]|uniref:malonate transporter subunit MadL n=1 Tax=Jiulongibacter sp. NS-SX5 TaxID=3463854 RepID=UPI0040598E66